MKWIALLSFVLAFAVSGSSVSDHWSFNDHPHPALSEMTTAEKLLLLNVVTRSPNKDISCSATLQAEFQIYRNRILTI